MLDFRVPERGRPPSRPAHVLGGIGRFEDGGGNAGGGGSGAVVKLMSPRASHDFEAEAGAWLLDGRFS